MASWLGASGRKQNIWCSCDLGPASLGISAMQLFILNTHITSFHFTSIFHTKKMRSYSRPTHSMGGALAGLVDGFSSKAPLHEWFQFFLLNLSVKSQLNGCRREYIEDIQWSAMWLIFCQVWLCHFYLMLTTQPHTHTGLLHRLLSLPSTPFSPQPLQLPYRFVSLASCSYLMSFGRLQFLFCPQE